jgi:hypothetical protein
MTIAALRSRASAPAREGADPRDRLAGCLLLLYAQLLTRTAALKTTDVALDSDGHATITLGRGAIVLPDPLGPVALALRDQRLGATGSDGWLMAGRKAGTHITGERLRERLKLYGITSRPGRHAALLALGARLPAPILAERLGFHQARAAQMGPRRGRHLRRLRRTAYRAMTEPVES